MVSLVEQSAFFHADCSAFQNNRDCDPKFFVRIDAMEINVLEGAFERITLNIRNNCNILVQASTADQGDKIVLSTRTGNGILQITSFDTDRHRIEALAVNDTR